MRKLYIALFLIAAGGFALLVFYLFTDKRQHLRDEMVVAKIYNDRNLYEITDTNQIKALLNLKKTKVFNIIYAGDSENSRRQTPYFCRFNSPGVDVIIPLTPESESVEIERIIANHNKKIISAEYIKSNNCTLL